MADERVRFTLTADDQTRGAFSSVRGNIEGVAKSLRSITGLGGGIIGAVALGEIKQAGTALLDARISAEKLTNTLTQAVGTSGLRGELSFIRDQASRLGLEFDSTAASYAKFAAAGRGTSLEGQQTREIFIGIAQASTALGLSSDETAGALTAVQQIISKGKVSAEELRGQLGERLPGAFQIAARSIGVTTQQLDALLQTGSLTADEFLPKFARQLQTEFADAAERAAGSTQASVNKMETTWNKLKRTLGEGVVGDAIKTGIDATTSAIDRTANAIDRAQKSSGTWLENLTNIVRILPGIGPLLGTTLSDAASDRERARLSGDGQDSILARRGRELAPRADGSTVAGLRRLDNTQGSAFDEQARADVRKLLEQFRSPDQKLQAEIADLRRLGSLTGQDVSGAIAEARRRAAGATIDMAKAYKELDAAIAQADLDDRLKQETKAAEAAADAFRDYVGLLGQIAGNEREGAEKALTPDVSGWQKVANAIKEVRGFDDAAKGRGEAMRALIEARDSGLILSDEEYEQVRAKILGLREPLSEIKEVSRDIFAPINSALENALVNFRDLADVGRGFAQDLARLFIRDSVSKPLAGYASSLLGSFGFGGARAAGGAVWPGAAFLVGEKGPELLVPDRAGTVIPNGALGGANVAVQMPLMVSDSVSRADAYNLVERGKREVLQAVGLMMARGVA